MGRDRKRDFVDSLEVFGEFDQGKRIETENKKCGLKRRLGSFSSTREEKWGEKYEER
jgi:hypothetical protein